MLKPIAVAVAEPNGEVRSLGTIPNREESIRRLQRKLDPPEQLHVCYEAGPTALCDYIHEVEHAAGRLTRLEKANHSHDGRFLCERLGGEEPYKYEQQQPRGECCIVLRIGQDSPHWSS